MHSSTLRRDGAASGPKPRRPWTPRLGAGCLLFATTATAGGPARADWPTSRHDAQRTGVSTGASDISTPAAYWRARLGGALGGTQIFLGDTNQDGKADVLYLAGGELVLANVDGTVVWRTGSRGYYQIINVADLAGTGRLDVIVAAPSGVSLVSGATGKLDWAEPAGEVVFVSSFRLGDVDGDGHPDLWLDSCGGCCGPEPGIPSVVYSFASGVGSPTMLGTPPLRPHCNSTSDTLADFRGDGTLQMLSMADTTATLFRGDGTVLGTSGPLPAHAPSAQCEAANLDGKPGNEAICFVNTVYSGAGARGLFALAYRPAETPPIRLLWSVTASPNDGGDAVAGTALTMDLDGDGTLEAVVSGKANGAYTTLVLDAASGAQLTTVPGRVVGDVPAIAAGQRWLLVATDTAVSALSFTRAPPALAQAWQVKGQQMVTQYDWARTKTSGRSQSFLLPDLDGDTRPDLMMGSAAEPSVLSGYTTAKGSPIAVAQYALDPGVAASSVGMPVGFKSPASLFVARNDGFVALLNASLAPINQSKDGAVTIPGLYAGGYYTGSGAYNGYGHPPIAGKLSPGDKASSVLVVDSRGDLVKLDTSTATNVSPATVAWRLTDSFGATLHPAGAGAASIGTFRRRHPVTDPPTYVMAAVSPGGQEVASLTLPRPPSWDVLPGDFAGDGTTGFVGLDTDAALNTDITAMNATGHQLWQTPVTALSGTEPLAVADWNGDGADDVAAVITVAHVYSGKTGAALATGADSVGYFTPLLASLNGGPQLDMVLQGGQLQPRALDHGLASLWVSSGPSQPLPYGSLAVCGPAAMLVEGSFSVPAQLTLTQATGAAGGTVSASVVLASGAAYPDAAAATKAGATLGQLGDVAVSTSLGAGTGPTALVGSTDGYLYAVDACSGALRWAQAFGLPVGSPILADTDGDGLDEILVSVADGYLYALKNQVLPAPAYVYDTDPPHGITDKEVHDLTTVSTLYATWAGVPGAASYEVTVVNSELSYITSPTWIGVGAVTSAAIPSLPLTDGGHYFIGVRAVSPAGNSPDTPSSGVFVHFPGSDGGIPDAGPADGGGGGGAGGTGGTLNLPTPSPGDRACSCSTPGREGGRPTAPLGLLLAFGVAMGRRRGGVARDRSPLHRTAFRYRA